MLSSCRKISSIDWSRSCGCIVVVPLEVGSYRPFNIPSFAKSCVDMSGPAESSARMAGSKLADRAPDAPSKAAGLPGAPDDEDDDIASAMGRRADLNVVGLFSA